MNLSQHIDLILASLKLLTVLVEELLYVHTTALLIILMIIKLLYAMWEWIPITRT